MFLAAKKDVLHFYFSCVCVLPIFGADGVHMELVRLSDLGLSSVEEGYHFSLLGPRFPHQLAKLARCPWAGRTRQDTKSC